MFSIVLYVAQIVEQNMNYCITGPWESENQTD